VILDQLERAFMVIGGSVITVSGGPKALDEYDIKNDNVTSELVVQSRPARPREPAATRHDLNMLTKQDIYDAALEKYGVELKIRSEKKALISAFLELQEHDE